MEMAYLVIQDKEIDLVAIVDNEKKIRIFGYQVVGIEEIHKHSPRFLLITKELDVHLAKLIPDSVEIVDIRI